MVVRRSGSEVALNANVQADRALILELVDRDRLRSTGADARGHTGRRNNTGGSGELLVEEEAQDFGRERQVLDRGPTGDHTEHRDVEVGVAGVGGVQARVPQTKGRAVDALCGEQI